MLQSIMLIRFFNWIIMADIFIGHKQTSIRDKFSIQPIIQRVKLQHKEQKWY